MGGTSGGSRRVLWATAVPSIITVAKYENNHVTFIIKTNLLIIINSVCFSVLCFLCFLFGR